MAAIKRQKHSLSVPLLSQRQQRARSESAVDPHPSLGWRNAAEHKSTRYCNSKEKQKGGETKKNGGSPLFPPLFVFIEVTQRASLNYHSQRKGCQIHLTDKSPFLITGQGSFS